MIIKIRKGAKTATCYAEQFEQFKSLGWEPMIGQGVDLPPPPGETLPGGEDGGILDRPTDDEKENTPAKPRKRRSKSE